MSTVSQFFFINFALVISVLSPSVAFGSTLGNHQSADSVSQVSSEVLFDPANGGECRGDDQCAAGGAY